MFEEGEGEGAPAGDAGGDAVEPASSGAEGGGGEPAVEEYDLFGEDVPEWMKEFDASGKPFKVPKAAVDALPMDAKQLIHNLRKMAFGRTAEAAKVAKAALAERGAIAKARAGVDAEHAKLRELIVGAKKLIVQPEGEAPDLWTEEGQVWRAKKETADYLQRFFDGFGKLGEEHEAKVKADVQMSTVERRIAEIRSFANEHADFKTLKPTIEKLVLGFDHAITAEDAYEFVKRPHFNAVLPDMEALRKAHPTLTPADAYDLVVARKGLSTRAARGAVDSARAESRSRVGTPARQGSAEVTEVPKEIRERGAVATAEWLDEHPDVQRAIMERHRSAR